MAKLSEQLGVKNGVATRTQRVRQEERAKSDYLEEKKKFEELKSQALAVQEKEFEGKEVTPESYSKVYQGLSPNLKTFFDTPEEFTQKRAQRIETAKQEIVKKREIAEQKLIEVKETKEQRLKDAQASYIKKKRRNPKNTAKYREQLDNKEDAIQRDYEEDVEKWKGYKEGLTKGEEELKKDKEISPLEIERFAKEFASFRKAKEEARNVRGAQRGIEQAKVKRLKSEGFKPVVVEESFKGSPRSIALNYYNPKTGQWEKGVKVETPPKVDIIGLEQIGRTAPQERTIEFGGKQFKFESTVPIFKTKEGEIVTPYEKTGVTEEQLIKEQQEKTFKEWQAQQKGVVDIPFKIYETKDLPIGYGSQQTVSDQPTQRVVSEKEIYLTERGGGSWNIKSFRQDFKNL